jgi:hypothetical protein
VIATVVYVLCALTSAACAVLLARGYSRTRVALLFWSSICFVGFFLHNLALILDVLVFTGVDLWALRIVPSALGVTALVYGLVREAV